MKKLNILLSLFISILLTACSGEKVESINVGFIGPLSKRAIDLGKGPAKALEIAVKNYNDSKSDDAPSINLFIEDDQWEKSNAVPLYDKLRKEHNIQVLFISNTGGTVALQNKIINDGVILINQINSDKTLSALNRNTFKIAKRTEE
jgi:ABC-type branched-subunit amino acid transport system substrate-binding protein